MDDYKSMWVNFANFHDRTSLRSYWTAFLFNVIISLLIGVVAAPLHMGWIATLYPILVIVPMTSMAIRRLHDAGKPWYYWLISLVPVVGTLIFLFFLCAPAVPENGLERV